MSHEISLDHGNKTVELGSILGLIVLFQNNLYVSILYSAVVL